MATRTSGRARVAPVYDERALSRGGGVGGPAWAREQDGSAAKENAAPGGGGSRSEGGRKAGGGAGDKARPARKSAPAVAQKGRDAGLERLPIEDAKPAAKSAGAARLRGGHEHAAAPAAAGKQAFPGGPVVKAGGAATKPAPGAAAAKPTAAKSAAVAPAAAAAAGGSSKAAAAAGSSKDKPSGSDGKRGSDAAAPAAKPAGSGGSSGKRKATGPSAAEENSKAAAKPAGKAPSAAAPDAKRHKAAAPAAHQAKQQQQQRTSQRAAPAAPAAAAAPVPAEADALAALGLEPEPAPGAGAEELVEHFSSNFHALHGEYLKLQALYEDLKAAKIDEEVQQLLEQQNRHVTEHGQKAAQLVEHYKAEAEQHAAVAAELGGEALVEQCRSLQADLMNCQQALLDKEAESLEKDRQLAALQSRLAFLERYARVYETSDKCIQTDPPPRASASGQFPSLQSSGVEMLQAHAMVPEGAGGGSMYKRPKQGGPQVPDPSYTLPGLTPLPPGAAAAGAAAAGRSPLAATAAPARSPLAAAVAATAAAPVSGSNMQLTGTGEVQPELQHVAVQASPLQQQQPAPQAQPRRQSLQPAAGRVAHAAAPALRPASAESQIQPAAAAAGRRQQRRQSAVPAPAPVAAVAAGGSRRVSAPPAPVDRELQFGSSATVPGHQALGGPLPLEAVPEEQPLEEAAEAVPAAAAAEQAAPQVQQQQQQQQPAASQVTAAGGGPLVRVTLSAAPGGTPASVPAPPRELALSRLTGLTSTPLKGGIYQFTDPRFGYVFQLGPASPDSADLREGRAGPAEPELCYRPITLGGAGALLPPWFHDELKFVESQRNNFFIQMMDALAKQ